MNSLPEDMVIALKFKKKRIKIVVKIICSKYPFYYKENNFLNFAGGYQRIFRKIY